LYWIFRTKVNLTGLLLLPLLLWACGSGGDRVNKSRSEIVSLLADMHVAEAAMSKVPDKYKDSLRLTYRRNIAELHKLQVEELDSILISIQYKPEHYQELTRSAMELLDSIERSLH